MTLSTQSQKDQELAFDLQRDCNPDQGDPPPLWMQSEADAYCQNIWERDALKYRVHARRTDAHGSLAVAKEAEVVLDTDPAGRRDAMNPVELMLSALAACMLKGIERMIPMLMFQIDGAEARLEAILQDAPPKLTLVRYDIIVDSPETDQRLDLLHRNILKYGTISNTLAGAVPLLGTLTRKI